MDPVTGSAVAENLPSFPSVVIQLRHLPRINDSVVINEVATVITADVMASNDVINVIDAVLVPAG